MEELRARGGASRTSELWEGGYSARAISSAVKAGRLLRPRRGWVAVPSLDAGLIFAIRHGVLLSCVTQARRLGVWVSEDPQQPHVAARARTDRLDVGARVHWSHPVVPRPPGALVDPLPNVLALIARCLPFEHALASWESALNKRLVDLDLLATLSLPVAARRVFEHCAPYSDSGLESLFKTRLRWLRVPIRPQAWVHGHRVDFLIGDRLVVQIDGKQHAGVQRVADMKHDAELGLRGYHVIRVGYAQVMHEWPSAQEAILLAIGAGLHVRAR